MKNVAGRVSFSGNHGIVLPCLSVCWPVFQTWQHSSAMTNFLNFKEVPFLFLPLSSFPLFCYPPFPLLPLSCPLILPLSPLLLSPSLSVTLLLLLFSLSPPFFPLSLSCSTLPSFVPFALSPLFLLLPLSP